MKEKRQRKREKDRDKEKERVRHVQARVTQLVYNIYKALRGVDNFLCNL